ncbi:hypothetical protein G4B88_028192 [Cannabis sativa]|uniref:Uncharacterized protein n=1 Tax=Cannabis sativa TaxID=3483 RepID=A0A7J6HVK5_CANSA|nr:hypothetical protein G4B88_028192 [Cannabis sativa]
MSNREESFEQALNHDPKSKKPKKKRGTTQGKYTLKMKSKGIQQKVTYNRRSQPVGKGAIRYSTYSGALARNGWVPIDLPNWHNADEVKLDMIWKEMKATFDLDDCVRHQTLSNIGNNWRGFKSRLTNNFIMKYMNDPIYRAKNPHTLMYPPAIYPGITQPVWHNFVASRTTPEFQELRKLQQARRAENDNPHRLGRKGYPNLEYELQQQRNTEEEIERAVLWKEARKDKKGEYAKESDKEIASTIDSLLEKRKQGEVVEIGTNDILSQALRTPESYGRVRARGRNVGFRDCFPKSKGGVRSLHERQIIYENETRRKYEIEIESLKKRTNDIENNFKAVMKALEEKSHGHQGLSTDIEAHFSPNMVQENEYEDVANDHVEQEHVEHNIEDKSDYPNLVQDESFIDVIVTPNEGTWSQFDLENLVDKQVAKGIIRQAAEVHNKPLDENSYRIEVNELLIPDALIPEAIDPDEIYLVKHVFRSYVAWPKHLVVLEAMWNDIMKKSESFMISVPVNEHMFGIKEYNIAVIKEDVEFMVYFDNITAACISLYMRFLYTILVENERMHLFTFLEPQLLAAIQGRTPDDRDRDLAKRLGEIIPGQQLMATLNNG